MGLLRKLQTSDPERGSRIQIQRTAVQIRSKDNPEKQWPGYVVITEIGHEMIFLFSTRKVTKDMEIEVDFTYPEERKIALRVVSCHDQVSSGRVMRQVTSDNQDDFPTKTYFRVYGQRLDKRATDAPAETEEKAA